MLKSIFYYLAVTEPGRFYLHILHGAWLPRKAFSAFKPQRLRARLGDDSFRIGLLSGKNIARTYTGFAQLGRKVHLLSVCALRILLEIEIDHIDMNTQEVISIDWQSKGVRLDVYAKNSRQVFDIEIQITDTGELPERARYYQSAMDVDCLKAGQDYKDLKNSYVIFICIPDIFHKGLPVYTFENLCLQDASIPLGDRTLKYFFISTNCDKLLNDEQKAFMRLVGCNECRKK